MNINSYLEYIFSFIFPFRKESEFFRKWQTDDYLQRLVPAFVDEKLHSLFSYKDPKVRILIRSIKKERAYFIGEAISTLMCDEILSMYEDRAFLENVTVYVVPIPISKNRMKERGFNQSAWIAELTAKKLGDGFVYAPYLLKKVKDTKKQALLKRAERLENPKGSFRARNVPGRISVILIDDVVTTGATTGEAVFVLRKSGARDVKVFSIAR